MRPKDQLSSMKRMIDDWSASVLSTKLALAHGEITNIGKRGPYPQRPCKPASGVPLPHTPGPLSASDEVAEELMMVGMTWSYQPSESS